MRSVWLARLAVMVLALVAETRVVAEAQQIGKETLLPQDSFYRVATKTADDRYVDPEVWLQTTPDNDGSWWPAWVAWLDAHSGTRCVPPKMGGGAGAYAPLCDAPGTYVLEH